MLRYNVQSVKEETIQLIKIKKTHRIELKSKSIVHSIENTPFTKRLESKDLSFPGQ